MIDPHRFPHMLLSANASCKLMNGPKMSVLWEPGIRGKSYIPHN